VSVIALTPDLAFFLLFWGYALYAPMRYLLRSLHRRAVPATHGPGLDRTP